MDWRLLAMLYKFEEETNTRGQSLMSQPPFILGCVGPIGLGFGILVQGIKVKFEDYKPMDEDD